MNVKKLVAAVIIGTAAVTGGIALAGPASADPVDGVTILQSDHKDPEP